MATGLAALRAEVAAAQSAQEPGRPGLRTYTGPSWHPVLMEWEVDLFPAAAGDNLDPGHRDYDPNFVTGNYVLAAEEAELLPRAGVATQAKAANVYSGRTILSRAARPVLSARVLRYLGGAVLTAYNDARTQADRPTVTFEELLSSPDGVLDWYDGNGGDTRLKRLIQVYRHLVANQDSNLSQALGGFNDALLMLRLTRQLPVADPPSGGSPPGSPRRSATRTGTPHSRSATSTRSGPGRCASADCGCWTTSASPMTWT
jgi:hypothetical protein